MNRIIRYFNQNRKKVYISLIIIVFLFGLLQLLNVMAKNKKEEEKDTSGINEIMQNNKSIVSNKSAVSGTSISEKKLKKDTDVIDNFFKYCNEGNIENAYNLLTDECKEEMYPTIDEFKRIYYNDLFSEGKRTYTIENWFGDTYQVRMTGDILSTGKIDGNQTKQDYVTIVEKDGDYKININNYVGRTKPQDKTTSYKNVDITIDEINTYMDYEAYTISVQNNTQNSLLLDTGESTKSVYLLDKNNAKSYFYSNEILKNKLIIQSKYTNKLKIKFASPYSSTKSLKSMVFSKFVLNYEEYQNTEDKSNYEGILSFPVKL